MKTAVITTGGLGTRLLTCTKSNPKAMLPLYSKSFDHNTDPLLRPLIETMFENLYDCGFRKFCFIVGKKTKLSIINHLTPDQKFIELLKKRNSSVDRRFITILNRIYRKFNHSQISWISQETPMGFGDALFASRKFVGNDSFLLHAGDTYIPDYSFMKEFIAQFKNSKNISGSILIQKRKILKGYGLANIKKINNENIVYHVEEKPKNPKSNLAMLPIYLFKPTIFEALKKTAKGYNKELQVTDAIETLIKSNKKITAHNFGSKKWYDVGIPINYFQALTLSYKKSKS
jgi:UTP--glucose-1-phosphate uridylyltransferase